VGSGANQKTRQLGSCSGLHAYFGWLCQCFSISLSLTFFFFSDNTTLHYKIKPKINKVTIILFSS
jgi:hypothetical protein